MPIELLEDGQDNGRRIVPYTTPSGLRIGSAYVPKPSPVTAVCIERYTQPRSPFLRWVGWTALAVVTLALLARV